MIIKFQYAQTQINNHIPLNLDKVLFIILHHTAAITASADEINQWHLANGWNGGAGYNEYIRKDGNVYIMRGDNIGAQTANLNSKSYGICCEGNYDIEKNMPALQYGSLIERIKYNKSRFRNLLEINGHNKYSTTSCPGKNFPMYLEFNEAVNILKEKRIINSPDYWLQNAINGKQVKGEYVNSLITKTAILLRG